MRITTTNDVAHKRLSQLYFGEGKIGKTSLALTFPVDSDSELLYVAADPGQLVLRERAFKVLQPDTELNQEFFDEALRFIQKNGKDFKLVFIDGVDEVSDAVLRSYMKTEKDGRKAYGAMAEYVGQWMKAIRDVPGISTVFVTHIERVDLGNNENMFIPAFPGKMIQEHVNEWFDLIGCMRMVRTTDNKVERFIQFDRSVDMRYMVGDRSGVLNPYEPPDLGHIFNKIHTAGYETAGEWVAPQISRSDQDLRKLALLMKETATTKEDIAAEFDFNPRFADDTQWRDLITWLEEAQHQMR